MEKLLFVSRIKVFPKKKSSAEWFRPVLLVKKYQEKKIWRGECSNVPKKSKMGGGKKKVAYRAPAAQAAPTNAVPFYGNLF